MEESLKKVKQLAHKLFGVEGRIVVDTLENGHVQLGIEGASAEASRTTFVKALPALVVAMMKLQRDKALREVADIEASIAVIEPQATEDAPA